MKALLNTLLIAFAVTTASFNAAQAGPKEPRKVAAFQSGIHTTADGKLQVAVQKETTSAVLVTLINQKGEAVFSQRMSKRQQALRFRFDVGNLPDGVSLPPIVSQF
ncbi:hypothetical protein LX87_05651 [Larkinella arboricola]|uniref:Uncharacterized protein n=1 Tax=Larkinella arboricola TaxID=643671 RepID=A0A327WFG1_LARAB|nr:hypothetical protein [Larkinella arboricola]RAJ89856.1 hypothetical protein LX87_05651 [Larkinella arboricola]